MLYLLSVNSIPTYVSVGLVTYYVTTVVFARLIPKQPDYSVSLTTVLTCYPPLTNTKEPLYIY